ncbi:hypothetical protein Bpfe_031511 [Biomphalaria pfeifferi]|uniref:Uncharacterized protein n=1 Tax=Biomphalaria pfeifferi TaxID=112525 RepID=A0AAD8AQJ5_BIOPF|nr:hypothetical protein Bpfe_031511 [Biomphalaria pfeifferi]
MEKTVCLFQALSRLKFSKSIQKQARLCVASRFRARQGDSNMIKIVRGSFAQLFIGFPHLAVVEMKTGATVETLWSDESAMDIAQVSGDWLCTWASGFDKQANSELRLLDG